LLDLDEEAFDTKFAGKNISAIEDTFNRCSNFELKIRN
jgi:hypothetical protein